MIQQSFIISLIGMSGSGKTYWSKKMAGKGFKHICCDDLISKELTLYSAKKNLKSIDKVAEWLGQPYKTNYAKKQFCYLAAEKKVMHEIIQKLKAGVKGRWIIDTTGSVIYTGTQICRHLKKSGENNRQALKRCYPQLLAYRRKLYQKYADLTLDYHALRQNKFTVDNFIKYVIS
ncbi:MAG: hypothetical protein ABH896_03210 [Candidatus Jacksonbacteria bacterium]